MWPPCRSGVLSSASKLRTLGFVGEGRVHTCLRFNLKFLSERCAAEENKLSAVEFRDIRLRPKLAKVCSEERAVYCKVGVAWPMRWNRAGCRLGAGHYTINIPGPVRMSAADCA